MLDRFFDSYLDADPGREPGNDAQLQEQILRTIHARAVARRRRVILPNRWLSLAAVVSLFVLVAFGKKRTGPLETVPVAYQEITRVTLPGERAIVCLPDGTTVHLNGNSKISYPENFGGEVRSVAVSGETYFEVVKSSKPFVVQSGGVRSEVLGTSFNVRTRNGDGIEVTLAEGKLKIVTASGASSVLKPNQQAVIKKDANAILTREVDIRVFTSWKDDILFFEDTNLKDAISAVESWYAVKIDIVTPALERCFITAKYKDEPLGNVLSSFRFLLRLDIRRIGKTHYAISGIGCN